MSIDPDALFGQILQRLQAMETTADHTRLELKALWTELKMHIRSEPEQYERIRMAIENSAKLSTKQFECLVKDVQEIKISRSKDKGFWAGVVFAFTLLGGVVATLLHKFFYGG